MIELGIRWVQENTERCPLCGSPVLFWGDEGRCSNCGARVERP